MSSQPVICVVYDRAKDFIDKSMIIAMKYMVYRSTVVTDL